MLYLKCTGEVQKVVGLRKEDLAEPGPTEAPLGSWYVNRFRPGKRQAYIFMSEETLLSFILFQGQKPVTLRSLPNMFLGGLHQLLQMRGLMPVTIDKALKHYESGAYARTNSRSDLGSLNDLVQCYVHIIESEGGLAHCDLTRIIMNINEMPQRKLQWSNAWEITLLKLSNA